MDNGVQHTGSIPFEARSRDLGVLIGFDGSEHSVLALHYAARAARQRGTRLTVVTAFTIGAMAHARLVGVPEFSEEKLKQEVAESVLEEARGYLKDYPGEVSYRSAKGDAAGVLVELSGSAQLAVVGARGRGGFLGRVLGSVATALPSHAKCPTVIVPRGYRMENDDAGDRFAPLESSKPVLVGVEGSAYSRVAALQAADVAAARSVSLHMVMALPPVEGALVWYPELTSTDAVYIQRRQRELENALEAEATWLRGHVPDLDIITSVEIGDPVTVLTKASTSAQLTVVGTHGRRSVGTLLMGSVSRGVLLSAKGPVMVVPRLKEERLADQPHFTS